MAKKEKKVKSVKKRAIFPLGAKFSFFVALLLIAIMIAITAFIYNWIGKALEKEVKERGIAIAKNIANNAADPLIKNDDLPLAILTKEAVQSPANVEATYDENIISNVLNVIKSTFVVKQQDREIKNEGIHEAIIVRKNGLIASANDVKRIGEKYVPPAGIRQLREDEDVLIQDYVKNGKQYFDIAVPITTIINNNKYTVGDVHLTISRSIISKVVLDAAVRIGLIILVSLILGILASVILVNFLVRPIGFLVKGVKAIGEGNYDVEIKLKTNDELGLLTEIFNDTAKSLKEKELIKGAFSKYISSEVMDEIINDPSKLSLHGKRLKATMLFTDIRGFTSMSEKLEPEQVVSIINDYLTVQTDKIIKYNGFLDKFVGDCVMAVYGIPVPKDDDAYRAVKTAIDIRESIKKLNSIRERMKQLTVGIGIGINTGDVVCGNIGSSQRMDYTVIGDNVNLASRLESNAPAGAIYVSESTYIETKDKFLYKELEPISVKGKKEPIKIFEPIEEKK
ncbi:MAG: HAMP domain-containing protein [Candidatus Goldbacteria bacterium]|nr:HAMP domain-containing protein [Candidatus Goldiibacteriota bacterium]